MARSGNEYLQNKLYASAISDLGSEAGISTLEALRIKSAVGTSLPDIAITDQNAYSNVVGYLANQMRFRSNQQLAQLKIPSIQLGDTTILFENLEVLGGNNTITSKYMYLINSEFMAIKTLRDGNGVWGTEFERIGQKLNKAVFYKWFGNLTTWNPRAHLVATNVS